MCFRLRVADPRDPTDIAALDVEYDVHRDPPDPSVGWRGHDDIEIHLALNKRERCVLWQLTAAQQADLIRNIHARHED